MKKAIVMGVLVFAAMSASALSLGFNMAALDLQLDTCHASIRNGDYDFCRNAKSEAVDSFKQDYRPADIANPKVKAMFAQWMTAMDTAGTRQGQAEEAKFHTLMNELKLD